MQTHYKKLLTIALTTSMFSAAPTLAAGIHGYAGVGGGYIRVENNDFEVDDNHAAWKVYGGAQLSDVIGVELGYYDFGDSESATSSVNATGLGLSALASFPFNQQFSVYARGGVLLWDVDFNTPISRGSDSDTDPFYGMGAQFNINQQLGLRFDYERLAFDRTDSDFASVNLKLNFQ